MGSFVRRCDEREFERARHAAHINATVLDDKPNLEVGPFRTPDESLNAFAHVAITAGLATGTHKLEVANHSMEQLREIVHLAEAWWWGCVRLMLIHLRGDDEKVSPN